MVRRECKFLRCMAFAGLLLSAMTPVAAQNLELLIHHTSVVDGADGVKRTSEFSERMVRTGDTLWISRILPTDPPSEQTPATHDEEHKHLDTATAARWISKDASGKTQLRLVPVHGRVVVDVGKADYDNVGFDGSWAHAWNLIDLAILQRMKSSPGKDGLTTYTSAERGRNLKVVWNSTMKLPEMVESSDGALQRRTVVKIVDTSPARPWEKLQGFASKEYSDFLD